MPQPLVRDAPQDAVDALKRHAAEHGRSAEAEHRIIPEEALRPSRAGFWERAAKVAHRLDGPYSSGPGRAVRIVVDASVAVKWVLNEPRTEAALALRDEELIAPALWLVEAANALWRHVQLGELNRQQALARLSELEKAPIALLAIEPHLAKALELATEADHLVYDRIDLALALHQRAHVVTDDRRFLAATTRLNLGEQVRLLGS